MNNTKFIEKCRKTECFKISPFKDIDFKEFKYKTPQEFFEHFWNIYETFKKEYKKKYKKGINNSYNGAAFQIIMVYLFDRENIQIDKMDEEVGIKFVKPDFLINSNNNKTIFISLKVSGRERWKQAEMEAVKYKAKYPETYCVLLMNHKTEVESLKKKVPDLDLDEIFYASSNDLNDLINSIKKEK